MIGGLRRGDILKHKGLENHRLVVYYWSDNEVKGLNETGNWQVIRIREIAGRI